MEPPPASRKAPKPLVLLFTQHTLTASWDAEAQRTPSEGACSQTELQRQRGRLERLAGRPSAVSPPPRRTHIWTSVLEGKCQAGPEAGARAPPGLLARRPLRCCCRGLPAARRPEKLPGRPDLPSLAGAAPAATTFPVPMGPGASVCSWPRGFCSLCPGPSPHLGPLPPSFRLPTPPPAPPGHSLAPTAPQGTSSPDVAAPCLPAGCKGGRTASLWSFRRTE